MPAARKLLAGTLCLDFVNASDDLPELLQAPVAPGQSLAAVRRFQTTLRRLLDREARGLGANDRDLAALNRILLGAGGRRGLQPTVRGYGWGWQGEVPEMERILWPVAWSAARLLAGPDLARLKECERCGRLFLDASRNRSRRWCDMQVCGNRAKVERHRQRAKASRATPRRTRSSSPVRD